LLAVGVLLACGVWPEAGNLLDVGVLQAVALLDDCGVRGDEMLSLLSPPSRSKGLLCLGVRLADSTGPQ
jgi:hypothetical protein